MKQVMQDKLGLSHEFQTERQTGWCSSELQMVEQIELEVTPSSQEPYCFPEISHKSFPQRKGEEAKF